MPRTLALLLIIGAAGAAWSFSADAQSKRHRRSPARELYSVSGAGGGFVLVEMNSGRTWTLANAEDEHRGAVWLPIERIDNPDEAEEWRDEQQAIARERDENARAKRAAASREHYSRQRGGQLRFLLEEVQRQRDEVQEREGAEHPQVHALEQQIEQMERELRSLEHQEHERLGPEHPEREKSESQHREHREPEADEARERRGPPQDDEARDATSDSLKKQETERQQESDVPRKIRESLEAAEQEYQKLKERFGPDSPEAKMAREAAELIEKAVRDMQREIERKLNEARHRTQEVPRAAAQSRELELKQELLPLKIEEQLLLESHGPEHPKVQAIRKKIEVTRRFLGEQHE